MDRGQMTIGSQSNAITRIELVELFGEYTYDIVSHPCDGNLEPIILYGDNGSGKTTILKLLVHLFSPEPFEGHRTAIGETQFRQLSVYLADGHVFTAERTGKSLIGPYLLTVTSGSRQIVAYQWQEKRAVIERESEEADNYMAYCRAIRALGVSIHFLSDSRKVLSFQRPLGRRRVRGPDGTVISLAREFGFEEEEQESWLRTAMREAVQSIRATAIAGTNRGFESANEIYKQIVSRLVSAVEVTEQPSEEVRTRLRERFQVLGEHNKQYCHFGLTPDMEVNELEQLLARAPIETLHPLDRVLTPYLDGVQARLDALYEVQRVVSSFSSLMTKFYNRKDVRLHVADGITIDTNSGQSLKPEDLSSGEQQLMLLMCNAIIARHRASLFAIDEPELSLNVKWQRKLVDALLGMLGGTACQLLLATHSIELLARFRRNVIQLTDLRGEEDAE